jgi:hypothetical protein
MGNSWSATTIVMSKITIKISINYVGCQPPRLDIGCVFKNGK